MNHTGQIFRSIAVIILFAAVPSIFGQAVEPQDAAGSISQQRRPGGDPIRQLNLTPEQREQIRTIRQQNQKERAGIGERVRETNQALEAVLDSDSPEEPLVEQRIREASAAQAAAMRMRILTEVRIRRVLTSDQRNLLRAFRQQANQFREPSLRDPNERLMRRERRSLENSGSRFGGPFTRRDAQRKARPIDQK